MGWDGSGDGSLPLVYFGWIFRVCPPFVDGVVVVDSACTASMVGAAC